MYLPCTMRIQVGIQCVYNIHTRSLGTYLDDLFFHKFASLEKTLPTYQQIPKQRVEYE